MFQLAFQDSLADKKPKHLVAYMGCLSLTSLRSTLWILRDVSLPLQLADVVGAMRFRSLLFQ